jgi:Zn-dependent protease with chaperone function
MMIVGMSFIAGDAMLVIGMPHIRYRREFAADAAGVALTGDPAASVALMIFFAVAARDSSVDSRPSPGRSHPPPLARVRAIIADHPRLGGRR